MNTLSEVAMDFMTTMTNMSLYWFVCWSHMCNMENSLSDFLFWAGCRWSGGGDVNICPLLWSDCYLFKFRLWISNSQVYRGGGSFSPWWLMDPDGFLMALGNVPANMAVSSINAMFHLWDKWNGDTIAPKHSIPSYRANSVPLFTSQLGVVKQEEQLGYY